MKKELKLGLIGGVAGALKNVAQKIQDRKIEEEMLEARIRGRKARRDFENQVWEERKERLAKLNAERRRAEIEQIFKEHYEKQARKGA